MSLLRLSEQFREQSLARNLYNPNNPYDVNVNNSVADDLGVLSNFISNNTVSSLDTLLNVISPNILGNEESKLLQIGRSELIRHLQLRLIAETRDELAPALIDPLGSALRGLRGETNLFVFPFEYSITKVSGFLPIVERFTGIGLSNFNSKSNINIESYIFSGRINEETGNFQLKQLKQNTSLNFYSVNNTFSEYIDAYTNYADQKELGYSPIYTLSYVLRFGNNESPNQTGNLGYLKDNDGVFNSSYFNKDNADFILSNPNNVDFTYSANNILRSIHDESGFGDINPTVATVTTPDNLTDVTGYEKPISELNRITYNPNSSTKFFFDTPTTTNSKNVNRGLVYYYNQIIGNTDKTSIYNNPILNSLLSSRTKFKDLDGKMVFKGNICKSWTRLNTSNGKVSNMNRYNGNKVEHSVIREFVIPKVFPVKSARIPNQEVYPESLMLTIENLAYTKEDLQRLEIPKCEWGNNYGRKMWFVPFIDDFNESTDVKYQKYNFIGRPESMYSYANSSRSASLSFVILMDYPSPIDKIDSNNSKPKNNYKFFCNDSEFNRFSDIPNFDLTGDGSTPTEETTQTQPIVENTSLTTVNETFSLYYPNDVYVFQNDYESDNIVNTLTTTNDVFDSKYNNENLNFGLNITYIKDKTFLSNELITGTLIIPNGTSMTTYLKDNIKLKDSIDYSGSSTFTFSGQSSALYLGGDDNGLYNRRLAFQRAFNSCSDLLTKLFDLGGYVLDNNVNSHPFYNLAVVNVGTFNTLDPDFFSSNIVYNYSKPNFPKIIIKITDNTTAGDLQEKVNRNDITDANKNTSVNTFEARQARKTDVSIIFNQPQIDVTTPNEANNTTADNTGGSSTSNGVLFSNREDSYCFRFSNSEKFYNDKDNSRFDEPLYDYRTIHFEASNSRFTPAFHSQTPEDYHRRLTFLQQLGRAGESKIDYGSTNSTFGRPPIAILRIGDFIHSRIIINRISFQYKEFNWDMNPEGMGVQPMGVKVSLSFDIIGGQSLKTHIDKLQTAFSKNYYANSTYYKTGIYKQNVEVEDKQVSINDAYKARQNTPPLTQNN